MMEELKGYKTLRQALKEIGIDEISCKAKMDNDIQEACYDCESDCIHGAVADVHLTNFRPLCVECLIDPQQVAVFIYAITKQQYEFLKLILIAIKRKENVNAINLLFDPSECSEIFQGDGMDVEIIILDY